MFEKEVAAYAGVKLCPSRQLIVGDLPFAIHLALKALGIREGDLVFCSSLTFAGSVNPVLYERAIPVFIDSDSSSWNMSREALWEEPIKFIRLPGYNCC